MRIFDMIHSFFTISNEDKINIFLNIIAAREHPIIKETAYQYIIYLLKLTNNAKNDWFTDLTSSNGGTPTRFSYHKHPLINLWLRCLIPSVVDDGLYAPFREILQHISLNFNEPTVLNADLLNKLTVANIATLGNPKIHKYIALHICYLAILSSEDNTVRLQAFAVMANLQKIPHEIFFSAYADIVSSHSPTLILEIALRSIAELSTMPDEAKLEYFMTIVLAHPEEEVRHVVVYSIAELRGLNAKRRLAALHSIILNETSDDIDTKREAFYQIQILKVGDEDKLTCYQRILEIPDFDAELVQKARKAIALIEQMQTDLK